MPDYQRVIDVAASQVGYREGISPSGRWNNDQKYSREMPGFAWSNFQAWCDTFVAWCFWKAGLADALGDAASAAVWTSYQAWLRAGRFTEYPTLGAQVIYGRNVHTGICIGWDDTHVYAIEGNAQPLSARVLTTRGYKRMGDVRVGDQVVDPMGHPSVVTGVFPRGRRPVYRVTLQDGSSTEACDQHLWAVDVDQWKSLGIVDTLGLQRLAAAPGTQVRVPQAQPVEYTADAHLPLDPYLLGLLIGDVGMSQDALHLPDLDPEIIDAVRDLLPPGHQLMPYMTPWDPGDGTWRITGGPSGNALITALKDIGLASKTARDAVVPDAYKLATSKDRLALLQGLMDSDGRVDASGRCEFSSRSQRLAWDVQDLIRSLGGRAALTARRGVHDTSPNQSGRTTAYRLQDISMPFDNPFRLARKADRFTARSNAWHRTIVAVEYVRHDDVRCLSVSAPSRLYLTDDFIPTHNTNEGGSAEGNGVYRKTRRRRDDFVTGYGVPRFPDGVIVSADPAWNNRGGGGPRVMFDSVNPDALPVGGFDATAGYVGGRWPSSAGIRRRFPNHSHVTIAINDRQDAMCLDVEPGDATPEQVPAWVDRQKARGVDLPIVYCNSPVVGQVQDALAGREVILWTAHYTYTQHICSPGQCGRPQSDGTQWADKGPRGENVDQSLISERFWAAIGGASAAKEEEFDMAKPKIITVLGPDGSSPSGDDHLALVTVEGRVVGLNGQPVEGSQTGRTDLQLAERYVDLMIKPEDAALMGTEVRDIFEVLLKRAQG